MELKKAKEILEAKGYTVEEALVHKGSIKVQALHLGNAKVRPTVYESFVEHIETVEELVKAVENVINNAPEFNLNEFLTKNYILEHCISCVRHETDDQRAVKWPVFGDLEEYIRIILSDNAEMSTVLTQDVLNMVGLSEEEVRIYSRRHLEEQAEIKSMASIMAGIMGIDEEDVPELPDTMYVASTKSRLHGAAVMLLKNRLQEFCEEHFIKKLFIIPSSTEEVIILAGEVEEEMINEMIEEVNATKVEAHQRLSSHVYTYEAE